MLALLAVGDDGSRTVEEAPDVLGPRLEDGRPSGDVSEIISSSRPVPHDGQTCTSPSPTGEVRPVRSRSRAKTHSTSMPSPEKTARTAYGSVEL